VRFARIALQTTARTTITTAIAITIQTHVLILGSFRC
jgi:hypothetical protein